MTDEPDNDRAEPLIEARKLLELRAPRDLVEAHYTLPNDERTLWNLAAAAPKHLRWLLRNADALGVKQTDAQRLAGLSTMCQKAIALRNTLEFCKAEVLGLLGLLFADSTRGAAITEGRAYYYALNDGPREITRWAAIRERKAYEYALYVDTEPRDDTRAAAINEGKAYEYAKCVDCEPRDDTRAAAIQEGKALYYALYVDHGPRDDTRAAAIENRCGAEYARFVDRKARDDTRTAACREIMAFEYALDVDKGPHDETRKAAIEDYCAYEYALYVDRSPRDDTRSAAIREGKAYWYARDVDKCPRPSTVAAMLFRSKRPWISRILRVVSLFGLVQAAHWLDPRFGPPSTYYRPAGFGNRPPEYHLNYY